MQVLDPGNSIAPLALLVPEAARPPNTRGVTAVPRVFPRALLNHPHRTAPDRDRSFS